MTVTTMAQGGCRLDWPTHWGPAPLYATPRNPDRPTRGDAVEATAKWLGGPLFPWQAYVAQVMNELDPATGELWFNKAVIVAPRRSGKTYLERSTITERCSRSRHLAGMSAQTGKEASERWAEVVYTKSDSLQNAPGMAAALHITKGNSNELCEWPNGSRFFPFAPVESAVHGNELDTVWITELWWHDLATKRALQSAYRPMWSVKAGQEVLESAAGTSRSTWLKSERSAGIEATFDPLSRTAFFLWGVPGTAEELASLNDDELVGLCLKHHPRRDHGLRKDFLLGELHDPDGGGRPDFLRAYCSVDADDTQTALVPSVQWRATRAQERIPHSSTGTLVGVGAACDRRQSAVAVAWARDDGSTVVELIAVEAGQAWVPEYVAAMPAVAAVSVDPQGVGKRVLEKSESAGHAVVAWPAGDQRAAGQDFLSRLTETKAQRLWHGGLDDQLQAALSHAELPASGGLRSRDGEPVTAVLAAVAAVWAAEHAPEPAARHEFRVY